MLTVPFRSAHRTWQSLKIEIKFPCCSPGQASLSSTMAVATSLDPLYPLRVRFPVSAPILELLQIDLYQYMSSVSGKVTIFGQLQHRLGKVRSIQNREVEDTSPDRHFHLQISNRRLFVPLAVILALLLTFEFVGILIRWLKNRQTLRREPTMPASGGGNNNMTATGNTGRDNAVNARTLEDGAPPPNEWVLYRAHMDR